MFQLSQKKFAILRSQFVTLKKSRGSLIARIQSPITNHQSLFPGPLAPDPCCPKGAYRALAVGVHSSSPFQFNIANH
jgi:hypothetical protein